jgi:hypothetical protein
MRCGGERTMTRCRSVGFRRTRKIGVMRLTDQQKDPPQSSPVLSFQLLKVKLVVESLCQSDMQ